MRHETQTAYIDAVNMFLTLWDAASTDQVAWNTMADAMRNARSMYQTDIERAQANAAQGQHFDGATYDPSQDHDRLQTALGRVFHAMSDGNWHTQADIAARVGNSNTSSVAARITDLRKEKFGSWIVDRRRDASVRGLWWYRLRNPDGTLREGASP